MPGNKFQRARRGSPRASRSLDLGLERPDRVPVLLTDVVLDVLPEYDYRVVVLFHAALWALNARLEPRHDALVVKGVLALEPLVRSFRRLKTNCTCVGKVYKALPVLDCRSFALGSRERH